MLETPLGLIRILKNGKEVEYIALEYKSNVPEAKEKPLAGCYRISVYFNAKDTIACELISTLNIKKGNSGGQDYACKVFEKENIELTIGTYDEINDSSCVCEYLENGLIFNNLTSGKMKQIVFGISWVTDLYKNDNRTWFASDPTYC
jgi:hypothetical protein